MSATHSQRLKTTVIKALLIVVSLLSARAQFTVQPVSVIQAEGLEAVFECLHPEAGGYSWFFNEIFLTITNTPPGVEVSTRMLTISGNVTYSNSVIQCRANTQSGFFDSQNATLQFIGVVISDVTVEVDTITLSWDDPFTTNIAYCVEAVQTVSSSETVLSECGLTGTQYTFTYPDHGPCDRFNFTITPSEEGKNGTSSEPVTGFFMQAKGTGGNTAVRAGQNENEKDTTFNGTVPSCFNFTSYEVDSDILPEVMTGSLSSLPLTFSLPTDNMTSITVTLTDVTGVVLVFENLPISTHDIQDLIMVTCALPNCINVTVEYAQGSLSPGALIVIVPVLPDNSLDYTNVIFEILPQNLSQNVNITVPTGRHKVFAFDLERNGVPRMPISMAADIEVAEVTSGVTTNLPAMDPAPGISANKSSNGDVTVTCSNASLNCLVLIQFAGDLDQLVVGLINATDDRTVVLSPGATGDANVVVFTWTNGESFINSQVSFVSRFQEPPPSTLATTSATTAESETTGSIPSPDITVPLQSLSSGAQAGIVIIAIVVVLILLVFIVLITLVCYKKKQARMKTLNLGSNGDYNLFVSNTNPTATNGGETRDVDLGVQLDPFYDTVRAENLQPVGEYDVLRTENMTQSAQYESIQSARTGTPKVPLYDEPPPPLPPSMIPEDSDAPPLPPAYVPDDSDAPPLPPAYISDEEIGDEEVKSKEEPTEVTSRTNESQTTRRVQYTQVEPKPKPPGTPEDQEVLDPTKVVYAEVDKKKLKPKEETSAPAPPTRPPPLTADGVRSLLHPLAVRWEDLGKALGVDEDRIDEIFTNNENDQLRFHDLVDYYFINVHYSHTWEEIVLVLRQIEENDFADRITREKVQGASGELPQYASVV